MLTRLQERLPRLRQPEYTGGNRCWPCTIVNLAIAVLLGGLIALQHRWAGIALAGVAGLLIYFRGYLIPGTPALTKRYLPERVRKWFGKEPTPTPRTNGDLDLERWLADQGIVEECPDVDDLCLVDTFGATWQERIEALRDAEDLEPELGRILGRSVESLTFEEFGDSLVARVDGRRVGQWESRAALLADLGAAQALETTVPAWDRLPTRERGTVLNGLRIFLEECPSCAGLVTMTEESVESCCHSRDVVAVTCEHCGARLLEADQPG